MIRSRADFHNLTALGEGKLDGEFLDLSVGCQPEATGTIPEGTPVIDKTVVGQRGRMRVACTDLRAF